MNQRLEHMFAHGKAAEALAGLGEYFQPDVTFRDEHDFALVIGALMEWAQKGNEKIAADALTSALETLLDARKLDAALRLLRSYLVIQEETPLMLPLNHFEVASLFAKSVSESAVHISQSEPLRNSLLEASRSFPLLGKAIGLKNYS
jgi:hypothetical protein